MQTATEEFKARAKALGRSSRIRVGIFWDGSTREWETDNFRSLTLTEKLADFASGELTPTGTVNAGSIVLNNKNGRYTPWNESAPDTSIHNHINGPTGVTVKQITIDFSFDEHNGTEWVESGEWVREFTGYLYNDAYDPERNEVTFALRDSTWIALQNRTNTKVLIDYDVDELMKHYASLGDLSYGADTIGVSPFVIPVAWLYQDSVLNDMQELAASVSGWLFGDNAGVLHFETADSWLRKEVAFDFTGTDFKAVPYRRNPEELAQKVIVETSPRVRTTLETVYTLDELKQVGANSTHTFTILLDSPAILLSTELKAGIDYWFQNAGGLNMTDHCTIALEDFAQVVEVTLTNNNPVQSATLAFLKIQGIVVEGSPTAEVERFNAHIPYERTRSVRGNFYLQTSGQSSWLGDLLRDRAGQCVPLAGIKGCYGIPWTEVGDKVTYFDNASTSKVRTGFVMQKVTRYDKETYIQDYTLADSEPWYIEDNYFYIGVSSLDDGHKCWY